MHFYMPHPPPKFNENCRKELQILDFEGWGPTGKYLSVDAIKHIKQDVKCVNKQILRLIKTIEKYDSNDFNLQLNPGYLLNEIYVPKKSKETQIIDGSTDEIVAKLTDILKNKIKVG